MRKSFYDYGIENGTVWIIDNNGPVSVTNNIENVVDEICSLENMHHGIKVVYQDSEGQWDGWDNSKQEFIYLGTITRELAIQKLIKTRDGVIQTNTSMDPKTLDITEVKGAKANISDLKVFGNGDLFQLICKASSDSQGWMKSTKAMPVPGIGVVVQVTTQQKNIDGTYSVAEALTFVPNAIIHTDNDGNKILIAEALTH